MISNLHIKNIGIIDDISMELNTGFNVLTGETGAGKTLIIDSLCIIAGGRFSKEMIRRGQDHSYVELCLYLPDNSKSIDGNIIVSREIYTNGRNLCKINGRLVTVNELKNFMTDIMDIHGQQDNQTILDTRSHIGYLDSFSGTELGKIKEKYTKLYYQFNEIRNELKNNYGDDKEKQRKLDLLKYQFNEIEEAKLKVGEEEALESLRGKILNAEKIAENLNEVDSEIGDKAIDSISNAVRALEKIEELDDEYKNKLNSLKSIYYDLQELARDVSSLKEDTEFNEQERKEVETRLDLLFSLKRKYGNTIEEIITYKEKIARETREIEHLDESILALKQREKDLKEEMLTLAQTMHHMREQKAFILGEAINKQLKELEMRNANVNIKVQEDSSQQFNENGLDKVEFLIKTNIGEEEKPLIKIASGGEMSRIMLAIKNVLADVDKVSVLVFDEIDTGISGKAANSVAKKMKEIAKSHQVLCITHLAVIAATGDYNYYIHKEVVEENTKTKVELLPEEEVIKEIAIIASGNVTDIAIQHARELREQNK